MKNTPHRSMFNRMLRRHVESASKKGYMSVEQMVEHLRSTNNTYARQKLKPFTNCVSSVMEQLTGNNKDDSVTRRRKKSDPEEERLQRIESEHLRKKKRPLSASPSGGASSSPSTSICYDDDSAEEDFSVSGDSVYAQKFEPEFDLMKSIIRENLFPKSKKLVEGVELTKSIELEITGNGDCEKGKLVNENSKSDGGTDQITNRDSETNNVTGPFFKDVGGMNDVIKEMMIDVLLPLFHTQSLRILGVKPIQGILLHGPPGCGKTMLAHAIANETGATFYPICATDLVSGVSGESEENIRELFTKAHKTSPSVIFIDEIDAIAVKRDNTHKNMECRIVTQLMTCMDESLGQPKSLGQNSEFGKFNCRNGHVLVIGATNRPDSVDPALRRPGRFDREFYIGVPDEGGRTAILSVLLSHLKVEGTFDVLEIARRTSGFVGADLAALVNKAGNLALSRTICLRKSDASTNPELCPTENWWKKSLSPEENEKIAVTMADFEEAAKVLQPSSKREGFSIVPTITWDDVGGLDYVKREFETHIVQRIKFPKDFEDFGIRMASGFLLFGPPGCGKTLIGQAVANEAGANFVYIKGPELLNKYVGEGELAVRTLFRRARTCAPCILFFDEVHSLTTRHQGEGGGRLLDQLLVELAGAESRKDVYVIGATNSPEIMDPAFLRPGRFGKQLYVPLPSPDERGLILKALSRNMPIDSNMDLMELGRENCENFSGADLSSMMDVAAVFALQDKWASHSSNPKGEKWTIRETHFRKALGNMSASVSIKQVQFYEHWMQRFKAS